jgi:hypothetical protein
MELALLLGILAKSLPLPHTEKRYQESFHILPDRKRGGKGVCESDTILREIID